MGFGARITEAVRRCGTPLVIGIDPRDEDIPPVMVRDAFHLGLNAASTRALLLGKLSTGLLDLAVSEKIPAVKIQSAFYEAAGIEGISVFKDVLGTARKAGLITIADVKRSDIGSTAEAYAGAYFGSAAPFRADAITANPLLGEDSMAPIVDAARLDEGGVFVLVRTSNPGGADFQELELKDGRTLSDALAEFVTRLGAPTRDESGYSAVGAVVGATARDSAARLRAALPSSILLAPGVGPQGAEPSLLRPFFDAKGEGALIPVSRSISGAWKKEPPTTPWEDACRAAIRKLKAEIAAALGTAPGGA